MTISISRGISQHSEKSQWVWHSTSEDQKNDKRKTSSTSNADFNFFFFFSCCVLDFISVKMQIC